MSVRLQSSLGCYAIVLPSLILLTTFVYIPVLWAFASSLYQFEIGADSTFVGLANYREYLGQDPTTLLSLSNMLVLTLLAVCMRMTFPLVVARLIYALPQERWRYIYRIVFLVPVVVPGVAVQLIWAGMIYSDFGLLVFKSYFEGLPEDLFESARIDGAGHLQIYWQIVLPLSKPILSVVAIMNILGTWNNFLWPFITNTEGSHHVVSSGLYVLATTAHASNFSTLYAAYAISSIPLLVLFIYATKPFIRGVTSGAFKA